ncbi:MAG: choice-of-anchor L domain-containing protein [Bacteroidota bacterium]
MTILQKYVTTFLLLLPVSIAVAQGGGSIVPTQDNDVIGLVQDVFIKGTCKNVSNIEGSGSPTSFGIFKNGGNVIGFPEGIMLSSGDVEEAVGPNTSVETSSRFGRSSTDKDLVGIATNQLFDVTVLEFDFVPLADEVTFQYVFASEEYCEFVGTIFNDVFGFFVSGPGINGEFADGAINVARLPDSEEFVSINTVNHLMNEASYVKNELEDDAANCLIPFSPSHLNTIEYDGFTTPLTARFSVVPCETYHIRLVVGDVGDDKLDSAVFLRSKSFDLGELASVKALVPNRTDTIAYEDCADGQFVFTRPAQSDRLEPYVVDFAIKENSTATEGADFQSLVRQVVIPERQNSVVLPIQSLADDLQEDLETLTLELLQICECEEGSNATLRLADAQPPEFSFPPIAACANQSFTLQPTLISGVEPLQFEWNDGTADTMLSATIAASNTYVLTVTDFCDNAFVDSVTVDIQAIPTATLSGAADFCEGQTEVRLPLSFSGNSPYAFAYSVDGNRTIFVENILDPNFNLLVTEAGNYELLQFSDAACEGIADGEAMVRDVGFLVETAATAPTCPDDEDGRIELNISEGTPPFAINWSVPVDNVQNPTNLSIGTYEVTVTDAAACEIILPITIAAPAIIPIACENTELFIPNVFSPNDDGQNDFFEIFAANSTNILRVSATQILDRWGNAVYTTTNAFPKWDGTFRGELLNDAVFFYAIEVELENGEKQIFRGTVTLVR